MPVTPKKRWPFIRTRTYPSGLLGYVVDARTKDGGERKTFDTRADAETFASACRIRRQNEGGVAFDDAELAKYGWTVAQAIRFAVEHLRRRSKSCTISEAVAALLAFKKSQVGEIRLADVKSRLDKFSKHFGAEWNETEKVCEGGRVIADITSEEVQEFLLTIPHPTTRNDNRKEIVMLWRYALAKHWVPAAIDTIQVPKKEEPEKSRRILTVDQARELMKQSTDPEVRAMNAMVLFGGLRVAEVEKLDWSAVDFKTKHIEVSSAVSKVDAERFAPILPNLAAWLKPLAKPSGPIVSRLLMHVLRDTWKAAKLHPWTPDWHRHSFISYRRVIVGDSQTAMDAGTSEKIIKRHYKRPVLKTEAAKFWKIIP